MHLPNCETRERFDLSSFFLNYVKEIGLVLLELRERFFEFGKIYYEQVAEVFAVLIRGPT